MISKTRFRFLRRLSTLVVVTLAGCQTETTLEQAPASWHLQVLNLSQLPPAIREQALSVGSALQKQSLFLRNERSFGTVANGRIHRVERPDGRVSYTLPLRKMGAGLYYDNLVIQQLPDGTTSETLIRYEPEQAWWKNSKGVYNYATYSGWVNLFTATGELLASANLQDGKLVSPKSNPAFTAARTEINCTLVDIQYAGLVQDTTYYITDIMFFYECEISYYNDSNLGGNGPVGVGGGGVGSAPTGEPEYAEDGGGTAGSGDTQDTEEEEEILIDPNFLAEYPCQAAIVQQVNQTDSFISELVKNTFELNTNINLNYNSNIIEGSPLANTDIIYQEMGNPNSPYYISINFDQSYLQSASDLSIASVTVHENLHAYLLYALEEEEEWLQNIAAENLNYDILVESFIEYRTAKIYGTQLDGFTAGQIDFVQHEILQELIHEIAGAIKSFGEIRGYTLTDDYYQALAWGGLQGTVAYTLLTDEEKQYIYTILLAENYGIGNQEGSPCTN